MSISAITSGVSSTVVLNPVTMAPSKSASTPAAAEPATSPASAASAAAPSTSSASAPASSAYGYSSHGANAASSADELTLVSSYSETVAGTQYSGSVEESGGEYVASVPNLTGATATGSSVIEAENNLSIRIDELV